MPNSLIDLFCGAGGLGEGFREEGFETIFANDFDQPSIDTFRQNHPNTPCVCAPIESLDPAKIRVELGVVPGQLDVVAGGPPCQGFSTYGQRRDDDPRNQLFQYFFNFVREFRPRFFVMENVTGLLSMSGGEVIAAVLERAALEGYSAKVHVLAAEQFGVPQLRRRVFIVGAPEGVKISDPIATHERYQADRNGEGDQRNTSQRILFDQSMLPSLKRPLTVRDAISDLPEDALPPKATQRGIPYPKRTQLTELQRQLRGNATVLTHHSAKQMLGIRKLRLSLLRPGDYGSTLKERIRAEGLPPNVIEDLLGGPSLRPVEQCRNEDREKDTRLRNLLAQGHLDLDDLLNTLDPGGFANKYRRLHWDEPSHTLVAHMARDCSDFVHPELDRFISVREAARLQTFPDTYQFPGSQFVQLKQIGNAVPPRLATAIAKVINQAIKDALSENPPTTGSDNLEADRCLERTKKQISASR